jgi:pSer/pThr/pTyr-binding forkhead associated (FHA) protein
MSANGTYVNGEKGLTTYLGNGDLVRFGTVDAVIQLGGAAQAGVAKTQSAATGTGGARSTAGIAAIAFAVTLVLIAAAFLVLK